MDVHGRPRIVLPHGHLPALRLSGDGIIPEQTAVVGPHPHRSVRVLAEAADDVVLFGVNQFGQRTGNELSGKRGYVIHAAIIGSDPYSALVVLQNRVDEFTGQGRRVPAVVAVQGTPAVLERLQVQQTVVRADQEMIGLDLRKGVDMGEPPPPGNGIADGPGLRVQGIQAQVPCPQPHGPGRILGHGVNAGRTAVLVIEQRRSEGIGSSRKKVEPLLSRGRGGPDTPVCGFKQAFNVISIQVLGQVPAGPAEQSPVPRPHPDISVLVLHQVADPLGRKRFHRMDRMVLQVPEHPVFRPEP